MLRIASFLLVLLTALPAQAGMLVNKDKETYEFAIFWDDLTPRVTGSIEPGKKFIFPDKFGVIHIPKRKDSIYVRPKEVVRIIDGVMRKEGDEE